MTGTAKNGRDTLYITTLILVIQLSKVLTFLFVVVYLLKQRHVIEVFQLINLKVR
jgi:hypothetical protein